MSAPVVSRRSVLKRAAAFGLAVVAGSACAPSRPRARVVVIGGGFAGATVARYLRLWDPSIDVALVERRRSFFSCPMSNRVLGGSLGFEALEHGYAALEAYGVRVLHDEATAVYTERRSVRLASGTDLPYDRLVMAPGIDFGFSDPVACQAAFEAGQAFHGWRSGPELLELRARIEAMPAGGVFLMAIPETPYRCPPGPYERACLVGHYFRRANPTATVLIFDANPDIVSKAEVFRREFETTLAGTVRYFPGLPLQRVEGARGSVLIRGERVQGDVLNIIPAQRAGEIARRAELVTDGRWCGVDWRSCESYAVPDVHVIGDATVAAPGMPKSGHMANAQAKSCAAAIVAFVNGDTPDPAPVLANTCYSFVDAERAVHVASVHRWDPERTTVVPVPGAGGLSTTPTEVEGAHAWAWARGIWADALG